jgi:ribonucleoside-diphosphate reductase alpha chain
MPENPKVPPDAFTVGSIMAVNAAMYWLSERGHTDLAKALKLEWESGVVGEAYLTKTRNEQTPAVDTRGTAVAKGYTGDECSNCGGMHMRISGHCMVCEDCGETTGCS